jgi:hypothetical protein
VEARVTEVFKGKAERACCSSTQTNAENSLLVPAVLYLLLNALICAALLDLCGNAIEWKGQSA